MAVFPMRYLENEVYALKFVVPGALILSIFLFALVPINDLDFWWHLKSGEYIIENRNLPEADPFSYTAVAEDRDSPGRPQFILKSYWLGQVIFAAVVKAFGLKGFIIMRAFVFASIAFTVLRIQSLHSTVCSPASESSEPRTPNPHIMPPAVRCILLLALALITIESLTDRPQMFSFLFAILLVFLLERYRLRSDRKTLYAVPLLMLLWAQIHAGYIVGVAYLLVYLMTIPFEENLREKRKIFIPLLVFSILVTYLNPCHWQGIGAVFYAHGGSMLFKETLEYLSPVTIMPLARNNPGWISYWALIGFSFVAAVGFLRKRSWSRLIILLGAAIASLISMRYTYFFAPLAVGLLPSALVKGQRVQFHGSPVMAERSQGRLTPVTYHLSAVIVALVLVFAVAFTYHKVNFRNLLKSDTAYGLFPQQASDYVLSAGIPQPIFNDINWGGFLIYRLWPEYKVFVDTRTMNIDIYRQYMNVLNDTREGRAILEVYRIKSIITPAINPYTGEIFPLVRGLMRDDGWALIYLDGVAMIFVKKEYANQAFPKSAIYKQVFDEVMFWSASFPDVPGYGKTMDEVQRALGGTGGQ